MVKIIAGPDAKPRERDEDLVAYLTRKATAFNFVRPAFGSNVLITDPKDDRKVGEVDEDLKLVKLFDATLFDKFLKLLEKYEKHIGKEAQIMYDPGEVLEEIP